jgi:hypothetical protein
MRALIVPFTLVGLLYSGYDGEPGERDMQAAFADTLALQVRNALDFAQETGGTVALERIRESRADHFAILSFRKLGCEAEGATYLCRFRVEIEVAGGTIARTLSGHFRARANGLVFAEQA